jgi:hypothetical protein
MRMIELRQMEVFARDAFAFIDAENSHHNASTKLSVSYCVALCIATLCVVALAMTW